MNLVKNYENNRKNKPRDASDKSGNLLQKIYSDKQKLAMNEIATFNVWIKITPYPLVVDLLPLPMLVTLERLESTYILFALLKLHFSATSSADSA